MIGWDEQASIVSSASAEELPTSGGVTARTVDDRANGLASNVLTAPPSAPLTDAALFIDVNAQTLGKEAQTKFLGWLFGGPWGGWCAPRRWLLACEQELSWRVLM